MESCFDRSRQRDTFHVVTMRLYSQSYFLYNIGLAPLSPTVNIVNGWQDNMYFMAKWNDGYALIYGQASTGAVKSIDITDDMCLAGIVFQLGGLNYGGDTVLRLNTWHFIHSSDCYCTIHCWFYQWTIRTMCGSIDKKVMKTLMTWKKTDQLNIKAKYILQKLP